MYGQFSIHEHKENDGLIQLPIFLLLFLQK